MRPLFCVLAASAFAVCVSQGASAQPAYKASDIVSHFSSKNLGEARALCIGTESECKDVGAAAPKRNDGFDLVINFDYNSDVLTRPARTNLNEFAKALKDPSLAASAFVVEGHTDGQGSDTFNLDLSMRRANAVVGYLESQGVPARRLEAKGYGKQRLLVPDPMDSSNRRVETRLRAAE